MSVAPQAITVGRDKNYDTAGFVASCRANRVTPHVAQADGRPGGSAIDKQTTRWAGYALSQQKRKRIEQVFGWGKLDKRCIEDLNVYRIELFRHDLAIRRQVEKAVPDGLRGVS